MKKAGKRGVSLLLVCLLGLLLPWGGVAAAAQESAGLQEEAVYTWSDGETGYALLETEEGLPQDVLGESAAQAFSASQVSQEDPRFYSQLNARQKACYDALEALDISRIRTAAVRDGYHQVLVTVEETAGVTMTAANSRALYTDICAAIVALRYDHPDYLWLSKMRYGPGTRTTGGVTVSTGQVNFSFFLHYDGEEQEMWNQAGAEAQAVADAIDPAADRYTQVKAVHDQLAAQATYNEKPAEGREESLSHQAYSCLVAGDAYEPVCDGYAKAFKMVCDLLEIPCVLVVSSTHMWNNVLMDDGDWYNVDVTWDDSNDQQISYQYFLVGSQTVINGTLFCRQPDHVERNIWQETSSALNQVTFTYPVKNHEAYEYLGQDYPALRFPDVKRSDWYYGEVEMAAQMGLFHGDNQGLFHPVQNITRAEFATVLYNALGPETFVSSGEGFTDVHQGEWFADAVLWAQEAGYVDGYDDGSFRPGAFISRQEMCLILYRVWLGQTQQETGLEEAPLFPDDAEISSWAREAVYACRSLGLVQGDGTGNFCPRDNTRRCEAARVCVLFFQDSPSVPSAA